MANGYRPWDRGRSREEEAASEESTATEAVTEEAAEEDLEADSKDACPVIMLSDWLFCLWVYCASVWFEKENVMC